MTLSVFPYLCNFPLPHAILLPTSAVNLPHICPPVVLYHLVRLGLSLFLCRAPASCCTPCSMPPSLFPSACCQIPSTSFSNVFSLVPSLHLSFSPQELYPFFILCSFCFPFLFSLTFAVISCIITLSESAFFNLCVKSYISVVDFCHHTV